MKTTAEMIAVMQHFENGGEVERFNGDIWVINSTPTWSWLHTDYRIKEYTYPMWFKNKLSGDIFKFIAPYSVYNERTETWSFINVSHTNKDMWEQVEEPKPVERTERRWKWLYDHKNETAETSYTSDEEAYKQGYRVESGWYKKENDYIDVTLKD